MTDEQLGTIIGAIEGLGKQVDNLSKKVDSNTERLEFLTEEVNSIKITQKEMQKDIDRMKQELAGINERLDKKERETEDYEKLNDKTHREIISIMEERFQTLQGESTQSQDNTSKMQLCHA